MVTCVSVLSIPLLLLLSALGPDISCQASEVFTAINDIGQAVAAGRLLADELKGYLVREEDRIHRLRGIIDRLENATHIYSSLSEDELEEEERVANPVSVFLTIIQMASDWSKELSTLFGESAELNEEAPERSTQDEASPSQYDEFDSRRSMYLRLKWYSEMLPGTKDIDGATDAILRLQQTYDIPASAVADGHILQMSESPKLSDYQCFLLGKYAYDHGQYARAEEWFRLVLKRIDTGNSIRGNPQTEEIFPLPLEGVLDYLQYSVGRRGHYREAMEITQRLLKENPNNENALKSLRFYESELVRLHGGEPLPSAEERTTQEDSEVAVYERLCRTVNTSAVRDPRLICHLTVPHPYFLVAPVKEEIMQVEPPIVLWHDFVTEKEVEHIQEIARPRLRRATVRNPVSGKLETAPYRITKNVWLPNDLTPIIKSINKRIEFATGLSMEDSEELQVANYGLGGHYAPHFDHARRRELDAYERKHGNRIATFMVYLTNVQAGGATVFTRTGARVQPVERAAVFWYNLLRSGDGDVRSRHAACPVLAGSKWVMNKWIRERGQEFLRPCLPYRDVPDPTDVDL
ncbi:Prolyl 4-hydroxylase, alpha polypeptide [Sparganum proliferum]